jgi:hypothetical protein
MWRMFLWRNDADHKARTSWGMFMHTCAIRTLPS